MPGCLIRPVRRSYADTLGVAVAEAVLHSPGASWHCRPATTEHHPWGSPMIMRQGVSYFPVDKYTISYGSFHVVWRHAQTSGEQLPPWDWGQEIGPWLSFGLKGNSNKRNRGTSKALWGWLTDEGVSDTTLWSSLFFQDPKNYMSGCLDCLCSQMETETRLMHNPAPSACSAR